MTVATILAAACNCAGLARAPLEQLLQLPVLEPVPVEEVAVEARHLARPAHRLHAVVHG